ncbi:MAG: TonB-dependent receptor [bacterium]|nr:TonB-dependent receptor [bacterium]
MRLSFRHGIITAIAIASAAAGAPGDERRFIEMPSQPLASSMQTVAGRFGIELLFSQDMLAGHSAPAISGRFDAQQALNAVLAGSGLAFRKTSDGSYVVVRKDVGGSTPDAVPEILVVGRRTQNTDVRRSENDFRPYHVITRREIEASHVSTVEELVAKQLPANAQGATLSQMGVVAYGETASSIDLRGLGPAQTLVLVDGRRLPQLAGLAAGFIQSDMNAISPEAIDRVEAITATAGGIYGPGATAGVVNVVLRRDYRGIDFGVTRGVTSRGDALYRRYDFRVGLTPDHGRTEVMFAASQSNFDGLDIGDREFAVRAAIRAYANDPTTALSLRGIPTSPSINVVSSDGSPLSFKPAYGGAALGATSTHVAPADGRTLPALVEQLTNNGGSLDVRPAENASGSGETLLSGRKTRSIVASVHRSIGPVEVFLDYLSLTNDGRARASTGAGTLSLSADNPFNPFQQQITLTVPDPGRMFDFRVRDSIERATAGVIVSLPGRWRGEADYSSGHARRMWDLSGYLVSPAAATGYYPQIASGVDPRNPLGDYSAYLQSLDGTDRSYARKARRTNRFDDLSVRLAGPVMKLSGGDLMATLSGELRREEVPSGQIDTVVQGLAASPANLAAFSEQTRSLYGELRAPVISARSGDPALELQLAVRRDWVGSRSPSDIQFFDSEGEPSLMDRGGSRRLHDAGTVFVASFKASPTDGLLLRGSLSTGRQPLTVVQLFRYIYAGGGSTEQSDPRRGNAVPGYAFDVVYGGPLEPKPERARSVSLGAVIRPALLPEVRFSLDYTHIVQRGEKVPSSVVTTDFLIANEDLFPGRVSRLPLTAEDAARGFTAGLITAIDASGLQTGSTTIDAFDGRLDWQLRTRSGGTLDFHLAGTWQPGFQRTLGGGLPARSYRNRIDGALAVRGNAGMRWSQEPYSLSVNGQLVGGYSLEHGEAGFEVYDASYIRLQGSSHVPAQVTFDAGWSYRIALSGIGMSERPQTLDLRLGIQNLFDNRPATVVTAPGDYNVYADARRRRFDLTVAASF